tara:strand:- start:588 stop:1124 length:537 start_codon:yes stop_codon:yes gene_type:complete
MKTKKLVIKPKHGDVVVFTKDKGSRQQGVIVNHKGKLYLFNNYITYKQLATLYVTGNTIYKHNVGLTKTAAGIYQNNIVLVKVLRNLKSIKLIGAKPVFKAHPNCCGARFITSINEQMPAKLAICELFLNKTPKLVILTFPKDKKLIQYYKKLDFETLSTTPGEEGDVIHILQRLKPD